MNYFSVDAGRDNKTHNALITQHTGENERVSEREKYLITLHTFEK